MPFGERENPGRHDNSNFDYDYDNDNDNDNDNLDNGAKGMLEWTCLTY